MTPGDISAEAVRRQDRDHVWHPMLQHRQLERRDLLVMAAARGCEVTDADGRTYLDAAAGLWNVNVGYGREEICRAVYEQLQRLPYYPHSQANAPAAALAARLAGILPGDLCHVYFSSSGSEANETAIKVARQYGRQAHPGQNRYKVIARYQGYHGWTCGALSATGQVYRRSAFEPLMPGFLHVDPPHCRRCPLGLRHPSCGTACAAQIEEVIRREDPETVAAVIAEPIIGGGGVIIPPDEYLPRLRQICDRYGVLLILDEVITGFGRTGRLFGCQHWDVVPDIMTMAKGLTSGYLPLGACAVTPRVFEAFLGEPGQRREFAQVATYGGHPACCAAGLANLEILLGERLWENAAEVGAHLLEQLRAIDSPWLGEVRGLGLMIAIELVDGTGALLDAGRTARAKDALMGEGVLVGAMSHVLPGPESVLFLSPPLVLTRAQADRIAGALRPALNCL